MPIKNGLKDEFILKIKNIEQNKPKSIWLSQALLEIDG